MVLEKEILDILAGYSAPSSCQTARHKWHQMLIRESHKGKLYKYQPFDSNGYSLDNLRNGTLHCSSPNIFNDPFDCNIGINISSLFIERYKSDFELIENVLKNFMRIVNGEIEIKDCIDTERRIIENILSNKTIMQFIEENKGCVTTDEEVAKVLVENSLVVFALLQIIFLDNNFRKSFGNSLDLLFNYFNAVTVDDILQFLDSTDSYELEINQFSRMCEKSSNNSLMIARILDITLNLLKYVVDVIDRRFIKKIKSLILVGCLSDDYKNRLMWSHYADKHKGFCIEYDFSNLDEISMTSLPFPVLYSENRPLFPWSVFFDKAGDNIACLSMEVIRSMLTKDVIWSYEKEWRIFIDASQSENLIMPNISCIYLGAAIHQKDRKEILKIAESKNIPVKEMVVDRGTYALHAKPILF